MSKHQRVCIAALFSLCLAVFPGCSGSSDDHTADTAQEVAIPTDAPDFAGQVAEIRALDAPDLMSHQPRTIVLPLGVLVPADLHLGDDVTGLSLVEGRLPAGLFIRGTGEAWGRPTRVEDANVTLLVSFQDDTTTEETVRLESRTGHFAIKPLTEVTGDLAAPFGATVETANSPADAVQFSIEMGQLPPGLSLDSQSGVIAGQPVEEGIFPFVIEAQSAGEEAQLATAIRIGSSRSLHTMAAAFETNALDHLIPNGMLLSSWPDGRFSDHGDSGMWSGTFLAAMALKASLTGEEDGMKLVEEGLTTCRMVTGVDGLTARGIEKDEWKGRTDTPNIDPEHPEGHQSTTLGYEEYRWKGDVSRDQWTGHFLGNSLTWLLASSQETRQEAAANMTSMAMHLWENDMEIHDLDGEVTKYGHMGGYAMDGGFPVPNGVNAVMSLAWFQAAALSASGTDLESVLLAAVAEMLSQPPEGWNFMTDAGEVGYIEAMEELLYPYLGMHADRKWFNMNITNDAFFHALIVLPDGEERDRIAKIWWDEMWVDHGDTPITRRAQSEANPWFTYMFLGATAKTDANALYEAMEQMLVFPEPPRLAVEIKNSDNPAYPHDPEWDEWSFDALPTYERCSGTNFVWQRGPYRLDCMGSVGQEYGGTDFLAPYWLGVSMGYIDPRL